MKMKTRSIFFLICFLIPALWGTAQNMNVRGNGKVVKKVIPITEYNSIEVAGCMDIMYQQSNDDPYLEVSVDENLLDYFTIRVEGKTLTLKYKKYNDRKGSRTYNIQPTAFTIKTNSKELKEIRSAGSGSIFVQTPLRVDKMEVNLAGSGNVTFDRLLEGTKGTFNLAGSGDIILKNIKLDYLDCSLAGSGDIKVKGSANRASYSLASSGEIEAFGCKTQKAECSVAGSGNINVYAVSQLDASVVGSGDILYRGNPVVSKSKIGSGEIRRVD